jgi:hypothetical protein
MEEDNTNTKSRLSWPFNWCFPEAPSSTSSLPSTILEQDINQRADV